MSTALSPHSRTASPIEPAPLARVFPRHAGTGLSLPLYYWLEAAKWAWIIIGAMAAINLLEKHYFGLKGTPWRMVVDPSEMSIRFFGLAHYCVATYMLFTSKKLYNVRGLSMLALFSLLAVAACGAFYACGGPNNILAVIAVFFFFLMHALRDEVFFYRLRAGTAIADDEYPHIYRMLIWLQVGGLCLLAALLYPAFIYRYAGNVEQPQFNQWINTAFPAGWSVGAKMLASMAPFLVLAAAALARIQYKHTGGILRLLRTHAPLTIIVLTTVSLALSSIVIGTWILNVIILIHFTGWFIFATAGIAAQPREVRRAATWRTPDAWFRRNLAGFWAFHGGLAAIFFACIAANHWLFAQQPLTIAGRVLTNPLTLLFSSGSLYYWTIAHCTLGFLPKPKGKRG